MRNTRQGSVALNGGERFTMQQITETMRALQETVAASRMDQECIQVDLAASQARNEELRRTKEELRRNLQQQAGEHAVEEKALPTPPKAFPISFSQAIMDVVIPATFVGPKATFTGIEDLETHLTAFHTQMILTGGSDAVHCKMFMSTLSDTTLDWFVSLPDRHVTLFTQFSMMFREQYIANWAPPPISKTVSGRVPKGFLNRFGAQVVRLNTKDENMMVHAFRKGIMPGPFIESLIRTFGEIRHRAVAYIVAEGELTEKCDYDVPTRPRGPSRPQPMRVHETTTEKKAP